MHIDACDLVGDLLHLHVRPVGTETRHQRAQKRARTTSRIKRVRVARQIQVGHHTLTKPVRGVILSQRVAGVDVNQLLIDTLQNIFFHVGKVVLANLVVELAQRGCQTDKQSGVGHPVKKVAFDKVRHIERIECIAGQDTAQFVVAGARRRSQHRIGQQLGKNTEVGVNQIDPAPVVKLTVGQLQKALPLLKRHLHGRSRVRIGHDLLHGPHGVDEHPRGVTKIKLYCL